MNHDEFNGLCHFQLGHFMSREVLCVAVVPIQPDQFESHRCVRLYSLTRKQLHSIPHGGLETRACGTFVRPRLLAQPYFPFRFDRSYQSAARRGERRPRVHLNIVFAHFRRLIFSSVPSPGRCPPPLRGFVSPVGGVHRQTLSCGALECDNGVCVLCIKRHYHTK